MPLEVKLASFLLTDTVLKDKQRLLSWAAIIDYQEKHAGARHLIYQGKVKRGCLPEIEHTAILTGIYDFNW
jgi:hypothetical protein